LEAAKEIRDKKLADADALLSGIDSWLMEQFGISIPDAPERSVFATTRAKIKERADADFHSPRFRTIRDGIENGKYPARPLEKLCSRMQSGFAAVKQDQAFDFSSGIPRLRPLNLNTNGEISLENTKFVPRSNLEKKDYCERDELLFNNTNSAELVGKSAVFELDQPCVCSNHMTRLRVNDDVNAYYLEAILNLLRGVGYLGLLATKFNNQTGINSDTLKLLRVPVPPSDEQNRIAVAIQRRRDEARRLCREAEKEWETAKIRFEAELLGDQCH